MKCSLFMVGSLPTGEIKAKKTQFNTAATRGFGFVAEINEVILNGKSQRLVKHSARRLHFKVQ